MKETNFWGCLHVAVGAYTEAEVAAIRAGVMHLPGRSYAAIKSKRIRMGLNDRPLPFTAAEVAEIKAGATDLPGRTRSAMKSNPPPHGPY
jgi:hypothetical protein